jgi:two-component system, OmpR family, response regulator ArlR
MRILLVEDERHIAEALMSILEKNKYTVDHVSNGEAGLNDALSGVYDLIILDIMLPKRSGLEILKEFRKENKVTPVIMLTALSEISDKIAGLDYGADDYIAKPYNTEELLARVRAALRRKSEIVSENHTLSFGDITLRTKDLKLFAKTEDVTVTLKECQLLEYLIMNKGIVVSKEQIIEKVWSYDSEAVDNHVMVYISFLRKKLLYVKSEVSIVTLKGVGYKLCFKD